MVVMVQKEVAREITGRPPDMSLLGVSVQLYGEPKTVKYVPARAFYPPPDVDSAILRITVYPRPAVGRGPGDLLPARQGRFFGGPQADRQFAGQRTGPAQAGGAAQMLDDAGIDPRRRAETLSLDDWGRLWRAYCARREKA